MEKNAYICMNKNCSHMTALLSDMDEIEKHPGHIIVNIKTLKEQLNDLQNPLHKLRSINRGMVMSDVETKIQELIDFSKALITDFGQKMRKFANDTMNIYDDNLFLINAVNIQDFQVIGDNSKEIQLLFNLDQKETEEKLEEAVNMNSLLNESTESMKIYMKKLYESINFGPNPFEIQKHQWSQSLRHKNIEIIGQNAKYGEHDGKGHVILLEPRIDFNSIQQCRVKFNGGNNKWIGAIRLIDYNILKQKDPDFKDEGYGQYEISYDGRVSYDNKQLPVDSIKFKKNDIIEVNWDGPRRTFGIRIRKIGTEAKFEMKVNYTENSELYFGVVLWKFNCSIE